MKDAGNALLLFRQLSSYTFHEQIRPFPHGRQRGLEFVRNMLQKPRLLLFEL